MPLAFWFTLLLAMAVHVIISLRSAPKETEKTLRQPKAMLVVGILGSVLFAGGITAVLLVGESMGIQGKIISISLLAVFFYMSYGMLLSYANWRIELMGSRFAYTTFLGRRSEYPYEEIESFQSGMDGVAVRMRDGRKLHFEAINMHAFSQLMKRTHLPSGGRKAIREQKHRLFGMEMRANRKASAIVLLVSQGLFFAGGIAALAFSDTSAPYDGANTSSISVRYEDGEHKNPHGKNPSFVFADTEGTSYSVSYFAYDVFAVDEFIIDVRKGDLLKITLPVKQAENLGEPLDVVGIETREWSYLSLEDVNRRHMDNGILGMGIGAVLVLLNPPFMFFTIYLLKHPGRFKRGQRLMFGSGS